ncbi:unnamed protein product [Miscanthus lutarioriparius]|uniref:F-box domain-containing protein n=1 Tax=Miscanthus lutarioriparius TaxID=422564 RepID=A0A811NGC5_9POAL|nr:unnamed protein product [Miscanthus lutarioriparius]
MPVSRARAHLRVAPVGALALVGPHPCRRARPRPAPAPASQAHIGSFSQSLVDNNQKLANPESTTKRGHRSADRALIQLLINAITATDQASNDHHLASWPNVHKNHISRIRWAIFFFFCYRGHAGLASWPQRIYTLNLLQEILLRIGFPADVIRASAACVTFRRLVTEPSFFRRYRSLHPSLLLGFLDTKTFQLAQAPHPNAPAARALFRAASFSFEDHLPRRQALYRIWPWVICDLRDGRVLLKCTPLGFKFNALDWLPELAVQRYNIPCFEAFLVPSSTEEEDERSFRVISMAMTDCMTKLAVFIFSSSSGRWSLGTSTNLDTLNVPPDRKMLKQPHLAHGCFFDLESGEEGQVAQA